ncbi:MAG: polysaccharide deacetylase family protein [Chloroflexi bacterium]|nr:polysaccharide deacetylase family protein [Chloroflexota bacterium]
MKYKRIRRRHLIDGAFDVLNHFRVFDVLRSINYNNLTVLNYHRVSDPHDPCCDTFKPNISATPEMFDRQLAYIKKSFNIVTAGEIAACAHGTSTLPPRSALITFDDGYADNYTRAYPLLKKHGLGALIFITTDFVGKSKPSFWDVAAYAFTHTKKTSAVLPLTGETCWSDEAEKQAEMTRWIETLKTVPEEEKQRYAGQLPAALEVEMDDCAFNHIFMTWDQVREMAANGIEFGSHTLTHPILTRISIEQARHELVESRRLIEQELGKPVETLAYPNGGQADFNPEVIAVAREAGYKLAFTLMPGSNFFRQLRADPYTIRRVFLSHGDSFPRFVAKVNGIRRIS